MNIKVKKKLTKAVVDVIASGFSGCAVSIARLAEELGRKVLVEADFTELTL